MIDDDELRQQFKALSDREDVAKLLEVKFQRLMYILYRAPEKFPYKRFTIEKKGGGVREISAPPYPIKDLQRRLNKVLAGAYKPPDQVHGFTFNRNIVSNAKKHKGKRWVLNIDLENFFPSINFGRVRGLFMAAPYDLPAPVATLLAKLCCDDGCLPQGAPTSPIISNMICARLDSALSRLAKDARATYTWYADDISFSSSK